MSETPTIEREREGAILRLTIANPARRNAMTFEMWDRLGDLVAEAGEDEEVRVLVLTGAGGTFCAGADISQFGEKRGGEAAGAYDAVVARAQGALVNCPKPTLAAIRGACYGGGVGLALACDLRLAARDAQFRLPPARLGLGYGIANVELLVRRIGESGAADLLFTARRVEAEEARRLGLVTLLAEPEALESAAAETAATIAGNAPLTLRAAKRALLELAKPESRRDLAAAEALVAACMRSADYQEGQAAFRERREPRFSGR